jgi:hypothetical protein
MLRRQVAFILAIFAFGCSGPDRESVFRSALRGDGKLKAEVIEIKRSGWFRDQYYLRISNTRDSTSVKVEHDLLDGRGGYESGVVRLLWLSEDDLFIERVLDDQPQSLIYSVSSVSFRMVGDSLSTLFKHQ